MLQRLQVQSHRAPGALSGSEPSLQVCALYDTLITSGATCATKDGRPRYKFAVIEFAFSPIILISHPLILTMILIRILIVMCFWIHN